MRPAKVEEKNGETFLTEVNPYPHPRKIEYPMDEYDFVINNEYEAELKAHVDFEKSKLSIFGPVILWVVVKR